MTINYEQIAQVQKVIFEADDPGELGAEWSRKLADLKAWQPDLFDWLTRRFNVMTSPAALLGVTIMALILIKEEQTKPDFVKAFNLIECDIHRTAIDKGWWEKPRNQYELLALIHAELSEVLEALRAGNPPDDKIPQFSAIEAELADAIIRILDMAGGFGYLVAEALIAKIEFNKSRTFRHGGKEA